MQIPISNPTSKLKSPFVFFSGFRLVHWQNWLFGDANVVKGKALVEADHVFNVKEVDTPGSLPVITGFCIPQTSVRQNPYKLFMELDVNRKVCKLECDCPDGVSCKHGYGLIHYMNTHRDESQTDVSCTFIEPSKAAKKMYPRGEEIEIIDEIPEKYRMQRLDFNMISDETKENWAKLCLKHGNMASPLFTICNERYPNDPDEIPTENVDDFFPEWVKNYAFQETDEDSIEFRVKSYSFST